MELHALDRQVAMAHAHDDAVRVPGRAHEVGGEVLVDDEGVVAGGAEGVREAAEQALAIVMDVVALAVDGRIAATHAPAVRGGDALVPEAHAEHRHEWREAQDGGRGDARLGGRAGPGGDDQVGRAGGGDLVQGDPVVPRHRDPCLERSQHLHEVVGERVVVVDDEHVRHGSPLLRESSSFPGDSSSLLGGSSSCPGNCSSFPGNCSWARSTARTSAAAF